MKIDKIQKVVICILLKLWMNFHLVTLFKKCSNTTETCILEIRPQILLRLIWHVYP